MSELICGSCHKRCILHEGSNPKRIYAYCPVHGELKSHELDDSGSSVAELETVKKRNKILERALEMAGDKLVDDCPDGYTYDCFKSIGCDKCWASHFITKAEEE